MNDALFAGATIAEDGAAVSNLNVDAAGVSTFVALSVAVVVTVYTTPLVRSEDTGAFVMFQVEKFVPVFDAATVVDPTTNAEPFQKKLSLERWIFTDTAATFAPPVSAAVPFQVAPV